MAPTTWESIINVYKILWRLKRKEMQRGPAYTYAQKRESRLRDKLEGQGKGWEDRKHGMQSSHPNCQDGVVRVHD